ncbi:MAG TPA: hypothetical protein VID28_09740 [Methylomirabilota bacterium]|jgi:hypothetical protein
MRVRPLLLTCFWVAVFIWVGYNGMQAVSSYFQANEVAEQAFRDASDKQRSRNPGELFSPEFVTDFRTGIVTGTRKAGLELDPQSLKVTAEGGLVRATLAWTYRTWPLDVWGFDTAVPVPIWLGRSFDPQLGTRRIF